MSDSVEQMAREEIAIIGMAGRFPGARNISEFWKNLCDGVESVRSFTEQELASCGVDPAVLHAPNYVNAGAVLEDAEWFASSFFGYSPREAELMDPQQRILLECAWEALENAGYDPYRYGGLISVYAGVALNSYFQNNLATRSEISQMQGQYQLTLGNEKDFVATRVAYKLNLKGPSFTVQTGCSTSLVAVHLACQSLLNGESDMAVVGGGRIRVPLRAGYFHVEGSIPSPDGHCHAFDARANGCIVGSGIATVVLKRVSDAVRDGDVIHAVIKGSAINNDGSDKIGFTAPSVTGQAAVIGQALAMADVSADTIGYVEAHGTGTSLGDPIEIAALTKAFRLYTARCGYCAIGSVKTNIGHLDAGAGVAGLIKVALALRHGAIPQSLNFHSPNPQIDFVNSPFFVSSRLTPWKRAAAPRRAGISSFGIGGTNAHVIVEEPRETTISPAATGHQLLVISAKTGTALDQATARLAAHLRARPAENLADVAYTLQIGRAAFMHRRGVVAGSPEDAAQALETGDSRRVFTGAAAQQDPPIVFMFPGQGSQYLNMGAEIYRTEPVFRAIVDRCATILQPLLDLDLRSVLFAAQGDAAAAGEQLRQTRITQPALFTVEYALAQLLQSWGIKPAAMIGHSVGEYVAGCVAGVFTLDDALMLIARRAQLVQAQPPGAMLAVRLPESDVRAMLSETLAIAAINAPRLCVVAGPLDAVTGVEKVLDDRGIAHKRLQTSHAFHSAMMDPVLPPFTELLRRTRLAPPQIPYVSNVTTRWITPGEATNPEYWAQHVRQTVRFADGLAELFREPRSILLEVGPGRTLTQLARQHPAAGPGQTTIVTLGETRDEECANLRAGIGRLWLAGVDPDWQAMQGATPRRRVVLPTYPFERQRHWIDPVASAPIATPTMPSATVPALVAAPPPPLRRRRLIDEIKGILHELSGIELGAMNEEATFLELGFESLFLTQANAAFQRKFGVRTTFRQLTEQNATIASLAAFVDEQTPPDPEMPPVSSATIAATAVSVSGSPTVLTSPGAPTLDLLGQQVASLAAQIDLMRRAQSHGAVLQTVPTVSASAPVPETKPAGASVLATGTLADQTRGPWRPPERQSGKPLTAGQQSHLDALTRRLGKKTHGSKQLTQQHRGHFADPRTVAGFRMMWKELVYPLVVKRSAGSRVWDIDDNEYIDFVMGFGVNLFGYSPAFVMDAVKDQLSQGIEIGPQSPLAGEVARRFCDMTGAERAAFCNTGSEAVLAAIRIARTVTGRHRLATFVGDYHGIFDEMLGRAIESGGRRRTVPKAPGIPPKMVEEVLLLDYGNVASLDLIREHAGELAAVIVEPVQSRHPDLQPREFLVALRKMTLEMDIPLIFDEMITGFRAHPAGAQGFFDVQADIGTYGKVIGGGFPIGIVAGKARFLDALDGGMWRFGDESCPEAGVTWFAGTFVRHPIALAASLAVLTHLKAQGPALQNELNQRTAAVAGKLRAFLERVGAPVRIEHFSSWIIPLFGSHQECATLLCYHLRDKGIHVTDGRAIFISTAHSDDDLNRFVKAFEESVIELHDAGFLPREARSLRAHPDPDGTFVDLPLTEGQKEIWLAAKMSGENSCAYNYANYIEFCGSLKTDLLRRAVQGVVDRHEALRIRINSNGEIQRVMSSLKLDIPVLDLSAIESQERNAEVKARQQREVQTPFNLEAGPLVRASILRLDQETSMLLLTVHHIICDGWSVGVLLRDIASLYNALLLGREAELPAHAGFKDYALQKEGFRTSQEAKAVEDFWLGQFATIPSPLVLPIDRPRPGVRTFNAARLDVTFGGGLGRLIRKSAAVHRSTPFAMLLAGFSALLFRLSGQEEQVIGISASGQIQFGDPNLVGHCLNLLPIRQKVSGSEPFDRYLEKTRQSLLDAFEHSDYTFGTLVRELIIPRDPSRLPLVSVVFNLDAETEGLDFTGLKTSTGSVPRRFENFDLFVSIGPSGGDLAVQCSFNTDLFDTATITRWLRHYETLLRGVAECTTKAIGELPILSGDEHCQLVSRWNDTLEKSPDEHCVNRLIEAQAARIPGHDAIVFGKERLTYDQLNRRANHLANRLREHGVGAGELVGVLLERSAEMVVALLAVWKARGAYVPLDPAYPAERIQMILEDARPRLVIAQESLLAKVRSDSVPKVVLDNPALRLSGESDEAPDQQNAPGDLAYVIFTSGSTGRPKGVEIEHRALANFLHSMRQEPGLGEKDVLLAVTTLSFDIAGLELWLPLTSGAKVVIARQEAAMDGKALISQIDRHGITILQATPITWRILLEAGWKGNRQLKALCGGEALPPDLAERLLPHCGELWNMYGPTETTIWSTCQRMKKGDPIAIGRPIANTTIYIVNPEMQLQPIGVAGELLIGGGGLARGYLNRPDLTAEKFIPNPFGEGRVYRTGDLAKRQVDGTLECLGRLDHQVKLRGFRIEPGEIEAAMSGLEEIQQVVVVVRDEQLAAFYVSRSGRPLDVAACRDVLRARLPGYMVPTVYVHLDELPLTPNGKVDRRKLLTHETGEGSGGSAKSQEIWAARETELFKQLAPRQLRDFGKLESQLNELCDIHILEFLKSAGIELHGGKSYTLEAIRRGLKVVPELEKYVDYMLEVLVADGVGVSEDGEIRFVKGLSEFPTASTARRQLLEQHPGFSGVVEMVGHCFKHLKDALDGTIPAISVLFPEGKREYLDRLLFEETEQHTAIGLYQELAQEFVLDLAGKSPIRILEVGGGTGMLTWQLLPKLRGKMVEYVFTDVGLSFIGEAKKKVTALGLEHVDCRKFDITRPGSAQGFSDSSFDLILGLNVVHATPDLDETTGNLRRLLKPGGTMCLVEYLQSPRWQNLIWGLSAGWWCFRDQWRSKVPLVGLETWKKVFAKAGLVTWTVPDQSEGAEVGDIGMIVGSVPGTMIQAGSATIVQPRTDAEKLLLGIWEQVLKRSPISIHDNFFDLGGHSLLAVRLFAEIEKQTGERLPLAKLFNAPTIENLARELGNRSAADQAWPTLVPIQPRGERPPLYCVHGAGGNILLYRDLAARLGPNQPVYGFQSQGLDGKESPLGTIEEMAARYVQELRALQPNGPYQLAGYCLGGLVAYQMARLLKESGESISLLALLDTYNPVEEGQGRRISTLLQRAKFHAGNLSRLRPPELSRYLKEKLRVAWDGELKNALGLGKSSNKGNNGSSSSPGSTRSSGNNTEIQRINDHAVGLFKPKPYGGRVTLFKPKVNYDTLPDPQMGWGNLAGSIEVVPLDMNPHAMLVEPYVRHLADELGRRLDEMQRGARLGRVESAAARDSDALKNDVGQVVKDAHWR